MSMDFGAIMQMLNFQRQKQEREEQRVQDAEQKRQEALRFGFQLAQNPDLDISKIAPSMSALSPADLPALIEFNKASKKKAKEQEAMTQLGSAEQTIRQAAPATAGVLGPSGKIERTPQANQAMAGSVGQIASILPNLPPELQAGAAALPATLRAANETGLQQTQADRVASRQEFNRQAAAHEAAAIRNEDRGRLEVLADSVALGLAGKRTTEADSITDLTQRLGDAKAVAQVMAQAEVLRPGKETMLFRTAAGETDVQGLIGAHLRDLETRTVATGGFIDADGKLRAPTRDDAILKSKGLLAAVDIAGKTYRVTGSTAAELAKTKIYQDQYASVDDMLGELTDIHDRIAARVAKGESVAGVGPGFPEFGASALRFVGSEDLDVGQYEGTNLLVTMELIRLQQEGRLSDYDAKSYLAVMPSRQQIGTPQGRARLEQVRRLMTTARLSKITPEQRKTVQRERTQRRMLNPTQLHAAERLDAVVKKMTAEGNVEGADPQLVAAKYREELAGAVEGFRSTGASQQWDVMPRVQDPKLAPYLSDPSIFPKPGLR